jgi:hypothetical protein
MINYCAVTCPVVTEAVKAGTLESRINMAIIAIETEKISQRVAAERFGVAQKTLSDQMATERIRSVADPGKPFKAVGKDGKARRSPASQEDIDKAWQMRNAGASYAEMEAEIGACQRSIRNWLKKPRIESVAPADPPPFTPEPPSGAPRPKRPQVPDSLKQVNQRERKWLRERWIQIANHLAKAEQLIRLEHHRLQSEYAGPQGSLMMVKRWETLAKLWAESGELQDFTDATGNPEAVTLAGLFSEIERSSRVSSQLIGSIETWTGCRPDPTRYQPTTPL